MTEYFHQVYTKDLHPDAEERAHLSGWPKVDSILLDSETWKAVNTMFELADKIIEGLA